MPWTIPPDSLSSPDQYPGRFGHEPPACGGGRSAVEAGLDLVETTQDYLACLAGGCVPGPTLASAWDEFYRTYMPLVLRVVRRRCGLAGEPDDMVQDVWLAIVAHLAAFRPDPARGPFRAWLLVVARRRLADRLRGDLRKIRPTGWADPPDHIEGAEEDPAVICERDDERAFLAALLATLRAQVMPLSYRILQMRALEGRAVPEVASLVGLTADQVRARHHRTVAKLRRLAGQAEGHDPERTRRVSENLRSSRNNGRPPDVSHDRGERLASTRPIADRSSITPATPRLRGALRLRCDYRTTGPLTSNDPMPGSLGDRTPTPPGSLHDEPSPSPTAGPGRRRDAGTTPDAPRRGRRRDEGHDAAHGR